MRRFLRLTNADQCACSLLHVLQSRITEGAPQGDGVRPACAASGFGEVSPERA